MKFTPQKTIVIEAGSQPDGGSIKEVSQMMRRTLSNTHQHIRQCKEMYGLDYKIRGDRFWIDCER